MTQESIEWLNANTLIGFADKRDQWAAAGGWVREDENGLIVPWHAQEGYNNAFAGPVPIDAINERLFTWEAESRETYIMVPADVSDATGVGDDGQPYRMLKLDNYQTIVRGDTNEPFAVFKSGYRIHQYREWLIDNVATILDDAGESGIESALLLKGGAIGCVTVMLADAVMGDAEYPLLSRLMAFTSMNGVHVTTLMRSPYSPVCDNSMSSLVAGAVKDRTVKYKHSKYSNYKVNDARTALGILYKQADEMVEFFDLLAKWEVSNAEMKQVINQVVPIDPPKVEGGKVTNQRSITIAENKQTEIATTYKRDPRVTKWDGTALGVLQAFNTWEQQVRGGIKSERVERNTLNAMGGADSEFDAIVLASLSDVTGIAVTREDDDSPLALTKVG